MASGVLDVESLHSYKKKFLNLLQERERHFDYVISRGSSDPVGLLDLQLKLSDELIAIEKEIKNLSLRRLTPDQRNEYIKGYKHTLSIFRMFGDSLAWALVKPYSIRQHVKHPPFTKYLIDQKRAFDSTVACASYIAKEHDEHVLVNDLTNCLRIADLTVCRSDECKLVEVKSIENKGELTQKLRRRVERQLKRMEGFDKLHSDAAALEPGELTETFDGYPENHTLIRSTPKQTVSLSERTTFARELNDALKEVRREDKDKFVTFDGITGYLLNTVTENAFKEAASRSGFHSGKEQSAFMKDAGVITAIDIFSRHADYPEIAPLANLFDPDIATDLIFGDLMITTVLSGDRMAAYLKSRNIEVVTATQNHFWKTKKYKIGTSTGSLRYPFLHVIYAAHSTEYLANYCIESHDATEEVKHKLLEQDPGGKLIDVLGDLSDQGI